VLETLQNLPDGVDGVRATGTVTRDDYERIFTPLLERAHSEGRRIRLLYEFPAEFKGFTAGAGLEDMRLGMKYLRLFERCAFVTNVAWIRDATRLFGAMMPCATRAFSIDEHAQAVEWLDMPAKGTVVHRLLADKGVLLVEPTQPLTTEDFDAIATTVDPVIEAEGLLRGIVVHARTFPGWKNLGALLRHLRFIRDHHRRVGRIAVAADGALADVGPGLADYFVQAQIRHFAYDQLDDAISWAGATA